jgi:hypothetical protein
MTDTVETIYHADTDPKVKGILETYRAARLNNDYSPRLRLHYGDPVTGQDWGDVFDVEGYIGRSTGSQPIPLLIANTRSIGGGGILDRSIVRIRFANRSCGGDLYRHPTYSQPVDHGMDSKTYERNFA